MTPGDDREQPRDLILAAAQDYDWQDLAPFVDSLRATDFSGDIHFFVSGLSQRTEQELRLAGVGLSQPRRARIKLGSYVLSPYKRSRVLWHFQPSYRRAVRLLSSLSGDRQAATRRIMAALSNVDVARYFWYLDHLSRYGSRYRHVMLTDVRDVVFTGSPFDFEIHDRVYFFLEDERWRINQNRISVGWLYEAYGAESVVRLGDRPLSCSGITIGTVPTVCAYLRAMVDELVRLPRQDSGIDQGVHTYVVYNDMVPNSELIANGDGPVLTVGLMPPGEALKALADPLAPVKVVHQYDRHPSLVGALPDEAGLSLN
jgi:hypothetical protein